MTFSELSLNSEVKSNYDLKATRNTFRGSRLHFRHVFFRQPFSKELYEPVSEVFYTSNTLSMSLCSSVQIRHCYVNFTTDNEGIQREKAAWKLLLSMKDKSYTRDCTKQTSKIPRLQNIDLNLLTITFHLSLFTKPAPLWLLLLLLLLIFSKRVCVFFLRAF